MFYRKKYVIAKVIAVCAMGVALFACGEGGSGGGTNTNTTPIGNAGTNQKKKLNTVVTLDGSGSSDAEGDILTYSWFLASKPAGSTATLSNATTVNPTFTPDVGGLYVANLIVNDGSVNSNEVNVTVTTGFLFPEYDRLTSCINCTVTYQWTSGPKLGQQFTTTTKGLETVPYLSGALTGRIVQGHRDLVSITTYNDGDSFKFLRFAIGTDNVYISSDCSLTAHPSGWSFDIVYNKLLFDQGSYFTVNVANSAICDQDNTQQSLFMIQDVTAQGTVHKDAIVWWTIDKNFPFVTPNAPALSNLGVVFPTSADTGGFSLTDVDILGFQNGSIAGGDIDAGTGTLNNLAERTAFTFN